MVRLLSLIHILQKQQKVDLDASDGFGMMLPSLAERWSKELGLDYTISGANTRFSFEKGMAFTFDYVDFAEKIAGGKYLSLIHIFFRENTDIRKFTS